MKVRGPKSITATIERLGSRFSCFYSSCVFLWCTCHIFFWYVSIKISGSAAEEGQTDRQQRRRQWTAWKERLITRYLPTQPNNIPSHTQWQPANQTESQADTLLQTHNSRNPIRQRGSLQIRHPNMQTASISLTTHTHTHNCRISFTTEGSPTLDSRGRENWVSTGKNPATLSHFYLPMWSKWTADRQSRNKQTAGKLSPPCNHLVPLIV